MTTFNTHYRQIREQIDDNTYDTLVDQLCDDVTTVCKCITHEAAMYVTELLDICDDAYINISNDDLRDDFQLYMKER